MSSLRIGLIAALFFQGVGCASDEGSSADPGGSQGAFGVVLKNTQADADLAARAACRCSGTATAEQCASASYDSSRVMFPPCYIEAFNKTRESIAPVTACAKTEIQKVQTQYEAQSMCGEAGVAFALLQLGQAVLGCARTDAALQPLLNACDGAPPQ